MVPMPLPSLWHLSVGGLVVLFFIALCWIGASSLPRESDVRPSRKLRATLATVAFLLILLCLDGPLNRASENWLAWHMVSHVLVMFYVPVLLVASGAVSLIGAALRGRRGVAEASRVLRSVSGFVGRPVVAVLLFNGVMVFWHIPAVFDWQMDHSWSSEALMQPSFIVAGYFFWRLLLNGPGLSPRARSRVQVVSVLATAFCMLVLAMCLSIGSKAPWYAAPVALHGVAAALKDQHYAAGVLWVCGDLWAIPALVLIALRIVEGRGGASTVVDHFTKRGS